jgi:hypothetical protein
MAIILQNKLKLYSAFVDFRKAFDKLNRRILIYKLLRNGLSTKSVTMVKSIYSSVRLRVKAGLTSIFHFLQYMNNLSSRCCRISGVFPNKTVSSANKIRSIEESLYTSYYVMDLVLNL